MWTVVLAVLAVLVSALLLYGRWRHQYWARAGVYSPPGVPLLGHIVPFITRRGCTWDITDKVYKEKRDLKIYGTYHFLSPYLIIMDLETTQRILIKNFEHFVDRRSLDLSGTPDEVFGEMLTSASGKHWKALRSIMTPTFTSGKLKNMFHLVSEKSGILIDHCNTNKDSDSVIELKEALGKYAVDVIGSCVFGLEISLLEGKNDTFKEAAENLFTTSFKRTLNVLVFMTLPKLAKLLKLSVSSPSLQYFNKVVKHAIQERMKGVLRREDFLDLLLDARKSADEEKTTQGKTSSYQLSDNTIVAQCVLFILAGFDTTASTLSFASFLLSKHPECQQKLRDELRQRRSRNADGQLSYEDIMEAKYLDAIVAETLRLYSPAVMTERKCTKEYQIPGTSVVIPKGMLLSIPIYSLHHDEQHFPEADQFRPDRFLPENRSSIPTGAYLPFGLGPRMCIAQRFALMETKIAIADLVLNFNMSLPKGFEEIKLAKLSMMRPEPGTLKIMLKTLH